MLRHPLLYILTLLLTCFMLPAQAQKSIRISGTVLQPDKKTPIPGASIVKINSNMGVISDEQGKFLIDVAQKDTLMVRAIGYKPLLYLPKQLPVSELRVNIVLQEDSVMLGEVEVTSRPSPEMIGRALRNMKREQSSQVKNPGYIPGSEPPPPPPAPAPTIASPIGLMYDMFSKEGKEKKKLQELLLLEEAEKRRKEREEYNKFFKDNTGYQ
ncbi:carboxypeptidase-like protein [Pontibacter ummariensis]|uniref:CarboxypepD_reg-like domain-containing protein n=1 Tax=Pontibacter ummariensis TaxID=1610492 RepID=A0A239DWS0_9BACT|nr:carboxypeptidase-like regulatory domain-containing protein [Pontibacter ummariensis]PRY13719.1 carboxypeptidase-like protein [Pontibacter ummariensis]SNS36797.1 CarboxypepD_reg-like domain-containing protein [Pontibacter ummariensis]